MIKKAIKIIAIILYAALLCLALISSRRFSFDALVSYSPSSPMLAALFLLGLYALKSISVFFPIVLLQIAAGFLFSPWIALFINLLGLVIVFTLPYFLGKFAGADTAERKIDKNEKLLRIIQKQKKNEFFLTFFLRVISCLPGDLVSMYLGTLKFDFHKYLIASVLGTLPGMIPATLMGQSITEPLSPQFIISVLITVVCSLLSMLIYYIYSKKTQNK